MTNKTMLLLTLGLMIAAGNAPAKIIRDSLYEIPKTKVVPLIDGKQDGIWKALDWNFQRTYNVGDPPNTSDTAYCGAGLTGMSKAMWDENNLYFLFYTVDDIIVDIPANPTWNQDAIWLYIDSDNSKTPDGVAPDPGGGLAPGDIFFIVPHMFKGVEDQNVSRTIDFGPIDTMGIKYRIRDVEDTEGFPGWMLEMKIPLENLGIDGAFANQNIGWELQQDESDDATAGRQSMSKWWSSSNNSWTNASIWGTAILSDRVVDTVLEIKKLPNGTTIAIDGNMDPAYKLGNRITTNHFRVDATGNISDPMFDRFLTAYPLWDNNNLYVFFDVTDDDIQDNTGQPNWNKDAVMIFIDADDSKVPDNVSPDPGGGLPPDDINIVIPHAYIGAEASKLDNIGLPQDFLKTGIEFKISERSGGWRVELKLPLVNLGIDAVENVRIGLEIEGDESDTDDGGVRGSIEKWWNGTNMSWTDASLWGTAYLGSPTGTPTIDHALYVSPASLSFGYNEVNTTSVVKSYSLSGSGLSPLSGSIIITAPKNFQVSKSSGSGFDSLLFVPYTGGTLSSTTIYVRFKPTAVATYSGFVTNSGGGVTDKKVSVSGNSFIQGINLHLVSVTDVPHDQGGRVTLTWQPSFLDTNTVFLPYYSIWRAIPQNILDTLSIHGSTDRDAFSRKTPMRKTAGSSGTFAWEWLANQPSHGLSMYAYTASTLYDSISSTDAKHYFMVSAQTSDPNVFYDSNIDSGYSVDNLPPAAPGNFTGQVKSSGVTLRWNKNTETDVKYYAIYRNNTSTVNPDIILPYAFTADTSFTDVNSLRYTPLDYMARAMDIHENISAPSNKISFFITGVEELSRNLPTEYVLEQNYPNPFNPSTSIQYGVPTQSRVRLQIYNLLGQMVSELVNSEQETGWYYVEWNAPVSSGLYFYRMEAVGISDPGKKFVQLRKMLLLK